jgi:hypothetical protein
VLQCYNCFHYGHTKASCRAKAKCRNCGDDFTKDHKCDQAKSNCINCKGCHRSDDKKCPIYLEMRKGKQDKVSNKKDRKEEKMMNRFANGGNFQEFPPISNIIENIVQEEEIPHEKEEVVLSISPIGYQERRRGKKRAYYEEQTTPAREREYFGEQAIKQSVIQDKVWLKNFVACVQNSMINGKSFEEVEEPMVQELSNFCSDVLERVGGGSCDRSSL